jgi:putative membrane protein
VVETEARRSSRLPAILLAVVTVGLVLSGIYPFDRTTWWMEVAPVLIAVPLLVATYRRFPFTSVTYCFMAFFAAILLTGGHWAYARVPLGNWARDAFDLSRNHFDRFGHFFQGFVPALIVRELLLRTSPLRPGGWLFTLATGVALSISAIYELVEWISSLIAGQAADEFLGSQGDPWDAQADMGLAFLGAMLAQFLFGRLQDRQIEALHRPS